jgi:hypothetical protein
MKLISRYETFDGHIHVCQHDAKKHLDVLYADVLCKVARDLVPLNYVQMAEYLDENLEKFLHLKDIKDDIVLLQDKDESDE